MPQSAIKGREKGGGKGKEEKEKSLVSPSSIFGHPASRSKGRREGGGEGERGGKKGERECDFDAFSDPLLIPSPLVRGKKGGGKEVEISKWAIPTHSLFEWQEGGGGGGRKGSGFPMKLSRRFSYGEFFTPVLRKGKRGGGRGRREREEKEAVETFLICDARRGPRPGPTSSTLPRGGGRRREEGERDAFTSPSKPILLFDFIRLRKALLPMPGGGRKKGRGRMGKTGLLESRITFVAVHPAPHRPPPRKKRKKKRRRGREGTTAPLHSDGLILDSPAQILAQRGGGGEEGKGRGRGKRGKWRAAPKV